MKILSALLFLLGIALVSIQITGAQVYLWSQNANTNANVDPLINWQAGMPASAIGNSSRQTLARIAQWRDDSMGGTISSTYASGTYSITTSQHFTALIQLQNQTLCFFASATSAGGDKIAVDGLTAIAIYAGGSPVQVGVMVANSPYCVGFVNVNGGEAVLRNYFANFSDAPVGAMFDFAGTAVPNSDFALANGQCLSQSTYATLFSVIGNAFGSCSSGLFALPDARGRVTAGVSNMGGSESGVLNVSCSSALGYCGLVQQTIGQSNLPNYTLPNSLGFSGNSQTVGMDQGGIVPNGTNEAPLNSVSGTTVIPGASASNDFQPTVTLTPSGSITGGVSLGGGGGATPTLQPTMMGTKLIRIQ